MGHREHQEEPGQAGRLSAIWTQRDVNAAFTPVDVDVMIFSPGMLRRTVEIQNMFAPISEYLRPIVLNWWNEYVLNQHITSECEFKTYKYHEIDINHAVCKTEFDGIANGTFRIGQKVHVETLGFIPIFVNDGRSPRRTMYVLPEQIEDIKQFRAFPQTSAHQFNALNDEAHWIGSPNTVWYREVVTPDVVITRVNGERI